MWKDTDLDPRLVLHANARRLWLIAVIAVLHNVGKLITRIGNTTYKGFRVTDYVLMVRLRFLLRAFEADPAVPGVTNTVFVEIRGSYVFLNLHIAVRTYSKEVFVCLVWIWERFTVQDTNFEVNALQEATFFTDVHAAF